MKTEDQLIAEWLLKYVPSMPVPAGEGGNAMAVMKWLQEIQSGMRKLSVVSSNLPEKGEPN